MTELIHVSADARLDALRRKLGAFQGRRVVFVLPDGWTELDNLARMRLVLRQAQIQQSEIALITTDKATRKAARQTGVPVFARAEDAAKDNWQMNPLLPVVDPKHPDSGLPEAPPWRRSQIVDLRGRPSLHKARQRRIRAEERYRRPVAAWMQWVGTLLMGLAIAAFLGLFAFYVLPAATVTMTPGRETLTVTVPLVADASLDVAVVEDGLIPARLVETTLEEYGTLATSGSQQKPTIKATGQVQFSNLGNAVVQIPADTIVTTSTGVPVAFRTTSPVELPGGVGQRVDAFVEALEPGINGNVRANTINTVSGALRFRARVTNPNGTFGGGSELVPVVTQADQDTLLVTLQDQVAQKAYGVLQEKLEEGEWLDPESVETYVIAQVFDQFKDDEAENLGLTLRVLVQGVAVDVNDMNDALLANLREAVPERGQLISSTFRTQRLPGSVGLGRSTQFTSTATAEYITPIDPVEVKQEIVGLPVNEALQTLQERWRLSSPPDIYQDPDWTGTLPRFPNRIQVRVEFQGALAADQAGGQ